MSPIQEGSTNIPQSAFVRWNDPRGTPLVAINRDGTLSCQGVNFPDGTSQSSATVVDATAFGADPTGLADSSAALALAIASIPNGGTVYLPAGKFKISETLWITANNITLTGAGKYATTLLAAASTVSPIVQIGGVSSAVLSFGVVLQNLTIEGIYNATQKGVYCNNCEAVSFNQVQFLLCGIAEDVDYGFRFSHYDCNYAQSGSGDTAATATVRIENRSNPSTPSEQFLFLNCLWEGDQTAQTRQGLGLYFGPSTFQGVVTGCKFDYTNSSFASRVIALYQTSIILLQSSIIASGSAAHSPTGSAVISIDGTAGTKSVEVSILGNYIEFWTTPNGVYANYAQNVTLSGNIFMGSGSGTAMVVTANAYSVQSQGSTHPTADTPWSNASATSGWMGPPVVNSAFAFSNGVIFEGSAPTVAATQVGLGSTTAATANAGSATLPAAPVGFLIINIAGTAYKLPYYAT